jgi:fibronectin-binding autotransporter adhesin
MRDTTMAGMKRILALNGRSFCRTPLRIAAMLLLVWNLQLAASPLQVVWTGAGTNDNWSTVKNWTCNGGACAAPMQNNLQGADVIFPAGLSSSRLGPVLTTTDNNLTLDSLSVSGSEYTSFAINSGLQLTISGAMSTFHVTGNGTTTINAITNDGHITINSALTNQSGLNNFGVLALNANVANAGGIIRNGGRGIVSIGPSATLTGGTLVGTISNNGAISGVTYGSGAAGATINGGSITGVSVTSGGGSTNTFNGSVTNNGSLTAGAGDKIVWQGGTNNGTLSAGAGTLSVTNSVANTSGTISGGTYSNDVTVTGGKIQGTSTLLGSATFSGVNNTTTLNAAAAGAALSFQGGSNSGTLQATGTGATLTTAGSINNTGGTIIGAVNNGIISGGTISGNTTGTAGTFNNVMFSGVNLTNGTITGASNTMVGTNMLSGTVVNNGTLAITSGTTTVASGATLQTDGGTVNVNGGTLNIVGTVDPAANFLLTSGSVSLTGDLDVNVADLLGGTIDGPGSFEGEVVNNGDGTADGGAQGVLLNVGGSVASGGTGTGDYTFSDYNQDLGGALGFTFADTTQGGLNGHDVLDVTVSSALLNGTLDLYNAAGDELNTNTLNTTLTYELINDSGGAVGGPGFSTVNAIGIVGKAFGTPGATAGWWLVYNGSLAAGEGDVELVDVGVRNANTPEPATDMLLGGAIIGLVILRKKLVRR